MTLGPSAAAAVHQVVSTLEPDDAVGNEVQMLRRFFIERGHDSRIFTALRTGREPEAVGSLEDLLASPSPAVVLYHLATASAATPVLAASSLPLVLVYHNVTPARFYAGIDQVHYAACQAALADVEMLRGRVELALGHSEFSRRQLAAMGFVRTAPVPLLVEPLAVAESREVSPAEQALLCVGRVAPNKCLEDAIRLLHALRTDAAPEATLWIAGDATRLPVYGDALRRLAARLDETGHVRWLGRVSRSELAGLYASAALYVSMSEHEGFAGTLVEAMGAGLPVLAHDAAAVGETLGGAGVLLRRKDPVLAAEAAAPLLRDGPERAQLVDLGRRRATAFDPARCFAGLLGTLEDAGVLAA